MDKSVDALRAYMKVMEYGDPEQNYYKVSKEFIDMFKNQVSRDSGMNLDQLFEFDEIYMRAIQKTEDKKYEEAIVLYLEALKHFEKHVPSHGNIGICYLSLHKTDEAMIWFKKALAIDSNYQPAQENIIVLNEYLDTLDESLFDLPPLDLKKNEFENRKFLNEILLSTNDDVEVDN